MSVEKIRKYVKVLFQVNSPQSTDVNLHRPFLSRPPDVHSCMAIFRVCVCLCVFFFFFFAFTDLLTNNYYRDIRN